MTCGAWCWIFSWRTPANSHLEKSLFAISLPFINLLDIHKQKSAKRIFCCRKQKREVSPSKFGSKYSIFLLWWTDFSCQFYQTKNGLLFLLSFSSCFFFFGNWLEFCVLWAKVLSDFGFCSSSISATKLDNGNKNNNKKISPQKKYMCYDKLAITK